MPKGPVFQPSEDDFLIANASKMPIKELVALHRSFRSSMLWPPRTAKSLQRRIEKLRKQGRIERLDEEGRMRAYYHRGISPDRLNVDVLKDMATPPKLTEEEIKENFKEDDLVVEIDDDVYEMLLKKLEDEDLWNI